MGALCIFAAAAHAVAAVTGFMLVMVAASDISARSTTVALWILSIVVVLCVGTCGAEDRICERAECAEGP